MIYEIDSQYKDCIIDILRKNYTLGCWINSISISSNIDNVTVHITLSCCVHNLNKITDFDKLRGRVASMYIKDNWPPDKYNYLDVLIDPQ